MNVLVSIIVILSLGLIALIGGSVQGLHFLFAIVIPYIAILTFIIGIVVRIVKWASSPVPFRITTTSGQQKSLDWIKPSKFDNPSTLLGTLGRMALEILFFRSLFRNTKAEIKDGKKLVYGADKWLWLFSLAFHWSFLIIVLRHFRFFTNPIPSFVPFLQTFDGFFEVGVPIIYVTNAAIVVALTFLFFRRIINEKVKYISLLSDYFPLVLIFAIALTGIIMRYFIKTDLVGIKEITVGLFSFNPILPAEGISVWFYIHFFLVCCLLIYFPMSKLVHFPGIFMSPTRNLANNNRFKRHINPWNDEFKLHYHTYEEYEDEFRDLMKGVGLPLDKEEK